MTAPAARSVVAVGSGKGGVGKSTVTLQLALACTARGTRVGILDADLYGPDIPLMVGISRQEQARQWHLWRRGGVRLRPNHNIFKLSRACEPALGSHGILELRAAR